MGLPKLGHAGDTRASARLSGRAFGALWPLCPRDSMEKLGGDRCQMGLSWANLQLFESFQRQPRDIQMVSLQLIPAHSLQSDSLTPKGTELLSFPPSQ